MSRSIKVTFIVTNYDSQISLYQTLAIVTKEVDGKVFIDTEYEWQKYVVAQYEANKKDLTGYTPTWVVRVQGDNIVAVGDYVKEDTTKMEIGKEFFDISCSAAID